jgi:hypothetical protein
VLNGGREGDILNPILFCVHSNDLIPRLAKAGIGCFNGKIFAEMFVYADDIAIIAATPLAMRKMLDICDQYANGHHNKPNAKKSKRPFFAGSKGSNQIECNRVPLLAVIYNNVNSWQRLGQI